MILYKTDGDHFLLSEDEEGKKPVISVPKIESLRKYEGSQEITELKRVKGTVLSVGDRRHESQRRKENSAADLGHRRSDRRKNASHHHVMVIDLGEGVEPPVSLSPGTDVVVKILPTGIALYPLPLSRSTSVVRDSEEFKPEDYVVHLTDNRLNLKGR